MKKKVLAFCLVLFLVVPGLAFAGVLIDILDGDDNSSVVVGNVTEPEPEKELTKEQLIEKIVDRVFWKMFDKDRGNITIEYEFGSVMGVFDESVTFSKDSYKLIVVRKINVMFFGGGTSVCYFFVIKDNNGSFDPIQSRAICEYKKEEIGNLYGFAETLFNVGQKLDERNQIKSEEQQKLFKKIEKEAFKENSNLRD